MGTNALTLKIADSDLPKKSHVALRARIKAEQTLGETADTPRDVLDALPTIIAERIKKILPAGFELSEIEMDFKVEGKIFGSGVGGGVRVKLRKK